MNFLNSYKHESKLTKQMENRLTLRVDGKRPVVDGKSHKHAQSNLVSTKKKENNE